MSELWLWVHGIANILAWGLLLPLGVLVARFYKVFRRQNWPAEVHNMSWWFWHQVLQYAGLGAFAIALLTVIYENRGLHLATLHGKLGLLLVVLALHQFVSAMLRGDTEDHYTMNLRRLVFELVHKSVGYAALALAPAVIVLGLDLAGAPAWVVAVGLSPLVALGALWIRNICARRFVSTYQAMWGVSLEHPGNRPGRQHLFQRIGWWRRARRVNSDSELERG